MVPFLGSAVPKRLAFGDKLVSARVFIEPPIIKNQVWKMQRIGIPSRVTGIPSVQKVLECLQHCSLFINLSECRRCKNGG